MIHYSLALLIVLLAWQRRSSRTLLIGATAVVLGACLAAFYLLPAIYEQRWVNIAEVVGDGLRPQDNFLFAHTADKDHDNFNRIVSWVAVLEMVIIFGAAWSAKAWRATNREMWKTLLGWALAASALMFPLSLLFWKHLPKLQFMQFPWRWLLCLSMIFSIFLTVGVRRWWVRAAICAAALLILLTAWQRIQPPWWDNADDLREMQDNMATGVGYEGTDEYTPEGGDASALDKDARNVTVAGPAHAAIRVMHWAPESRAFTVEMSASDQLALRLYQYPAWKVEVNGHTVQAAAREDSGQMLVPVEQGLDRVQLTFIRTWDRTAGGWISLVTVSCLALVSILCRRRGAHPA